MLTLSPARPGRGRTWQLTDASVTLGRAADATVSFADTASPVVSDRHARITFRDGWYELTDAGSTNGTLVNGRAVVAPHALREGDVVQLGRDTGPELVVGFVYDRDRWQRAGGGATWDRATPMALIGMATALVVFLGVAVLVAG